MIHPIELDDVYNRLTMANTAALAVFTALESDIHRPEELLPGLYAVIDYQNILLKELDKILKSEVSAIDLGNLWRDTDPATGREVAANA